MHLKSWRIDMTREEAKQLLPIIQAFAEGKAIESRCIKGDKSLWYDDEDPSFDNDLEYRLKTEPKYLPFANAEECFAEMQKHHPFGWIKPKGDDTISKFMLIDSLMDEVVTVRTNIRFNYQELLEHYTFADRTPLGIIEEE